MHSKSWPHLRYQGVQVSGFKYGEPNPSTPLRTCEGDPNRSLKSNLLKSQDDVKQTNYKHIDCISDLPSSDPPHLFTDKCRVLQWRPDESYLDSLQKLWTPWAGPCCHPGAWMSSQQGSLYGPHRSKAIPTGTGVQTAWHQCGTAQHRACWDHGAGPWAWGTPSNSSSCGLSESVRGEIKLSHRTITVLGGCALKAVDCHGCFVSESAAWVTRLVRKLSAPHPKSTNPELRQTSLNRRMAILIAMWRGFLVILAHVNVNFYFITKTFTIIFIKNIFFLGDKIYMTQNLFYPVVDTQFSWQF